MEIVFREAERLLERGETPFVLATVVRTHGSTPQKPGAKLLVRSDGSGVGTIGGGCVEGDIWFAAKMLLQDRSPAEHREYQLNQELAAADGLVCGGTMYFLIDPIYSPEGYTPFAQEVVKAYEGGSPVALASLVKPARKGGLIGSKLFVREDGSTIGSLGDPAWDAAAKRQALELAPYGKEAYLELGDGAAAFLESYTTPPTLVMAGGGHISKAVAPLAKALGFRLFIIDDRPEFANVERFPEATETVVADYADGIARLPINPNTAIVVATRGHRHDDRALEAAARSSASYVGLIGSQRKGILIYQKLLASGSSVERVKAIHTPVGLAIGARTPEEIAVSIMAEIIAFRHGSSGGPMKMEERRIDRIAQKAPRQSRAPASVA